MTITSTVAIDLVDRDRYPLAQVYAKQDDSLSRAIAASIYAAGVAWVPPSGATAVIRYRRPDGIGGIYDELPDGSVAYTIADNVITAYIAPDALSCPGRVRMDIVIVNGTEALATFDISVLVDAAPTSGVAPTNGYYKYKTLADINAALAARVQSVNDQTPDNKGNVRINAEQTGAVSQTAFDAAMTTVVKKVNGVTPDANGNVNVSAESGGNVLSVNGKTGAVQIPVPASGVCSVGAEIPTKVVESVSPGASPVEGAMVYVKFEAANTAENPTLTFMGYTAPIVDGGGNAVSPGALNAGTHGFQRRGETWVLLNGSGAAGEDGGYYAPSVDSGGNLTWTASKAGMPQVSGANIKGHKGVGIASIARTSGTGAAGTTDTYTITLTDGSTSTFTVYNGKDGTSGSGSSAVTSVNGKTGDVKLPVSGFGTCATAAATAIKVVDGLSENFLVEDGVQLCVKFSNANTAAAPQLSVAGASAPIFDARTSNNVDAAGIGARTHHFVYFSGIWVLLDALQIPVPTGDDHGKFLRGSGHAYVLEALSGGGAAAETWDLLINAEIAEDCTNVIFNSGDAGEILSDYKELLLLIDLFGNTGGFTTSLKIGFLNAVNAWSSPYFLNMQGYSAETVQYYINMFRFKKTEYGILPVNRYTQYNKSSVSNCLRHANGNEDKAGYTDFSINISSKQHVTADMIDFTSQKDFERLVIGGYQAVIGAGTIIKVWGMK